MDDKYEEVYLKIDSLLQKNIPNEKKRKEICEIVSERIGNLLNDNVGNNDIAFIQNNIRILKNRRERLVSYYNSVIKNSNNKILMLKKQNEELSASFNEIGEKIVHNHANSFSYYSKPKKTLKEMNSIKQSILLLSAELKEIKQSIIDSIKQHSSTFKWAKEKILIFHSSVLNQCTTRMKEISSIPKLSLDYHSSKMHNDNISSLCIQFQNDLLSSINSNLSRSMFDPVWLADFFWDFVNTCVKKMKKRIEHQFSSIDFYNSRLYSSEISKYEANLIDSVKTRNDRVLNEYNTRIHVIQKYHDHIVSQLNISKYQEPNLKNDQNQIDSLIYEWNFNKTKLENKIRGLSRNGI